MRGEAVPSEGCRRGRRAREGGPRGAVPPCQPGSRTAAVGQAPAGGQVVLGATIRLQKLPQHGRVSFFSPSTSCSPLSGNGDLALPAADTAGCCWLSLNHIPQFPPKAKTERGFCLEMTLWVKEWYIPASSKRNKYFLRRTFPSPQKLVALQSQGYLSIQVQAYWHRLFCSFDGVLAKPRLLSGASTYPETHIKATALRSCSYHLTCVISYSQGSSYTLQDGFARDMSSGITVRHFNHFATICLLF